MNFNPHRKTSFLQPIDQLLETVARGFDTVTSPTPAQNGFRVDLIESDSEYRIEAELPGVDEKDIDVALEEGVLSISAVLEQAQTEEGEGRRYVERRYGSFLRSFRLASEIQSEAISASMRRGVLTVVVPKAEVAKPVKIEVRSADD